LPRPYDATLRAQAGAAQRRCCKFFESTGFSDWLPLSSIEKNPKAAFPGQGTYAVGLQIKPGTYKAVGAEDGYRARLRDASGGVHSIIANEIVSGQAIVQIKATDEFFTTSGVGEWRRVG
jgi:hypothetical protein